jgi:putative ABC transport system permease protein
MSILGQSLIVFQMNLKTLPQRLGSSFVVVAGIAGVVGVLVSVLALGNGLQQSFTATGRTDRAIIVAKGSFAESGSVMGQDAASTIAGAAGIAKDAIGQPLVSREFLAQIPLVAEADRVSKNVALRGVEPAGLALRPEMRVVEGREFKPGLHEVMVGSALQSQFGHLTVGDSVRIQNEAWRVVGRFTAGGGSHDSEIIGDAATLLSAFHRTGYQSIIVRLSGPIQSLEAALKANPSLSVEVHREDQYFADQSKGIVRLLKSLGYFVGGIMAVGAIFAALNTMYAAVNAQLVMLATLRALGFRAFAVLAAIFMESFLLALIGAALGTLVAWLLFSGHTINMLGASGNQSVFVLHITLSMFVLGAAWSIVIGFAGGLFPALRAVRLPVATALREL